MTFKSLLTFSAIVALLLSVSSCYFETEDPGPLQEVEREYSIDDFNRLEIGDAMVIKVQHGNYYQLSVRGDSRNVDDLDVYKEGSTLIVRFDENRNRRHDTYVTVTMPDLRAANFSGASSSTITGFYDMTSFDLILSGASSAQLDMESQNLDAVLSGASLLTIRGNGDTMNAEVSGASMLRAFDYPVKSAHVNASGASSCKLSVTNDLTGAASGASVIVYRGNPSVNVDVSDSSTITQD